MTHPAPLPAPLYQGSVNTWECDEMGHMNVRFYVAKMMEGLAEFAHAVGLDHAFRKDGPSTLRPREQHIRFMREARAGEPFTMVACVLEVSESSFLLYQQINHMNGEPCAAYRTWVDHIDVSTGLSFPWSAETRRRLEGLKGEAPTACAPRSIDLSAAPRPSVVLRTGGARTALIVDDAITEERAKAARQVAGDTISVRGPSRPNSTSTATVRAPSSLSSATAVVRS